MYRGIVKEVFIPGVVNTNGSYSGIMEAKYLGFKIQLVEYCTDNCISKDNVFVNKNIIVIELDTDKTASINKNDKVVVNNAYFSDACDCMMSITDSEQHMILNLSRTPCIRLDNNTVNG